MYESLKGTPKDLLTDVPDWVIPKQHELLIGGIETMRLPPTRKLQIATSISQLIAQHPDTMLQFTPESLIEQFMDTGNAVVILDSSKDDRLIGFAKNYLWPGVNQYGQRVYEFGSWAVFPEYGRNGFGYHLAMLASDAAKAVDPQGQLIAVCSLENPKPISMLHQLGAITITKPSNVQILLGEGNAAVEFIDMSELKYHL